MANLKYPLFASKDSKQINTGNISFYLKFILEAKGVKVINN